MNPSSADPTLRDLPAASRWIAVALIAITFAAIYAVVGYLTAYGPHLSVARSMLALYHYEEWTHCALVPFIVAGLVWWKRRELAEIPVRPSTPGLVPVAAGFGFFWVSYRLDDIYFAFISVQCLTFGTIVFFLGWRWMRALLFPWLFLIFAWPLFFLDNVIAFPLRMVMSALSTGVLNALGMSTIQVGTSIQSAPDPLSALAAGQRFQVDVADPCSGMRSLFALTMVTALYGYFTMRSGWKHLILFLCAVPLAILGNLARILMLTVGILILGPKVAIGTLESPSFYHMFSGFFVFIVALGGMLLIASTLNRDPRTWGQHLKSIVHRDPLQTPPKPSSHASAEAGDIY
ncbi:MAG: exosortase/archaeosortase family protein [Terrimicrobiaceae bacterium]|nr:exosortase/archaeosortase family protein [Terrimicrobiaceae bacterium]